MVPVLAIVLSVYLLVLLVVALLVNRRVKTEEDYIVAGRRLPMSLAAATLFATWFGAGTLLTATDEISSSGLPATALEPYGAGLCLVLAGVALARRLWSMELLTVSDVFLRFGPRAEALSVVLTVPGYVGWLAVQLVALAGTLHVVLGIPIALGIVGVAAISLLYTLLGGMWSVTVTDAIQMVLIVIGVLWLGHEVFATLGHGDLGAGLEVLWARAPERALTLVPRESLGELTRWLSVLLVSMLGNLPSQELAQRIMAARSADTARRACILAGVLYVGLGTVPALVGVAAPLLLPAGQHQAVLQALALKLLSPALVVLFVISIVSVVLSTLTSGLLAPATTLAHNLVRHYVPPRVSTLAICRGCVVLVLVCSIGVAMWGADAYEILEASYAIGLVGMFVPFVAGIYGVQASDRAAVLSMLAGMGVWSLELVVDTEWPMTLLAVLACGVVFGLVRALERRATA
ncbi:MAG: sodium:solute symporter family protein [Myxococcales bacterium]|nr:sodium:solute symporter family protein [Myxococcales bacterium]